MKKIMFIHSALLATAISGSAFAADGTINFTGKIIDDACKVDTSSLNVPLGSVAKSSFGAAGASASPTRFTIKLKDCPASVTSASIHFDGPTDSVNSKLLALTSGASVATNVGIGIYEQDSNTLIPIGSSAAPVAIAQNTVNELNFIAKYVSTAATVVAGTANAVATFTISYN